MLVWGEVLSALDATGQCVLVSIVNVAGSSPREVGARMVVRPDMSFKGTIGGGRLEFDVLHEAVSLMKSDSVDFQTRSYALGPDLGQCCGGRVEIAFEQFFFSISVILHKTFPQKNVWEFFQPLQILAVPGRLKGMYYLP